MNQSILFPDIQTWDADSEKVVFPAQQSGALIECEISKSKLEGISGASVDSEEEALQQFKTCRFDIEELAEELIEDEMFNSKGRIEIN
ncbi:DUF1488 domain-containing protein [Vibrio sp. JC009]|uniref:DUF1488 domain-containing protein n=1 Tax=Vibrio sp. JC009 TaxID=2912314 RepID=UPI0023B09B02|nr:DUF1488 domain-containing protein [Vibrio sp. JC009]WED21803.1 DUF1488 domain-containing protein [Vibrio sp. JC009]